MNLDIYRKNKKLKGVSFKVLGFGFAKVGSLTKIEVGSLVNFVAIGGNFSLTVLNKTLSHTKSSY